MGKTLILLSLFSCIILSSLPVQEAWCNDSVSVARVDSINQVDTAKQVKESNLEHYGRSFLRFGRFINKLMESFSDVDTNYIKPQLYNYQVMLQATASFENFTIRSRETNQSISFAPKNYYKIGPYLGWRWIFLGYTFDVKKLWLGGSTRKPRTEFDISLYSTLFGIDFYYRRTGNDYQIHTLNLGRNIKTSFMENTDFSGINVGVTGLNFYYIFNHRRFSCPAAFSESTCQRRSAGSFIAGLSWTRQSLNFDCDLLQSIINSNPDTRNAKMDSSLMVRNLKYTDISVSAGYAYSWVFARNWLVCATMSPALAYNHTHGELERITDLSFNNINIDFIGRFSVVWNNTRWFAGANAIMHSYNYKKSRFSTTNFFGSINVYFGYNFSLRKQYRKSRDEK